MKGRIDGDYLVYVEGTTEQEPIQLHHSFSGKPPHHHINQLLDIRQTWAWGNYHDPNYLGDGDSEWRSRNHFIALEYECGIGYKAADKIVDKLMDGWRRSGEWKNRDKNGTERDEPDKEDWDIADDFE